MAIRFVVLYLALTMALVVVLNNVHSDCRLGYGSCIPTQGVPEEKIITAPIHYPRKLLHGSSDEKKEIVFTTFQPLDPRIGPSEDGGALRTVPSGPDPLHHHGGGAKKPQTP